MRSSWPECEPEVCDGNDEVEGCRALLLPLELVLGRSGKTVAMFAITGLRDLCQRRPGKKQLNCSVSSGVQTFTCRSWWSLDEFVSSSKRGLAEARCPATLDCFALRIQRLRSSSRKGRTIARQTIVW